MIICTLCFLLTATLFGQKNVTGTVVDAKTHETLPFVNVYWTSDANAGTVTDMDGNFSLQRIQGCNTLKFGYVGYKPHTITLDAGQTKVEVELQSSAFNLNDVTVTASRKREKYRRKGNPAVELMEKVIANKNNRRIESLGLYKVDCYEKLTLSLDRFDFDFDSTKFLKDFAFVKPYIDTSKLNKTPVLNVSLRETLSEHYYRNKQHKERILVSAKNMQGVDKVLDKEGLSTNLEQMFQRSDIFENDMELLLNKFVSPLSSSIGIGYYRYFIMDTVEVDGYRCVDMSFVPNNRESYGFSGHLYIMLDEDYAIKKYSLSVPKQINLNFVNDITIEQEYGKVGDSLWAPQEANTYVNFYLFKNMRQIYAHQTRLYGDYDLAPTGTDTIFAHSEEVIMSPDAEKHTKIFWTENRPRPLTQKESLLDSLMVELKRVPKFNATIKAVEIVASGYVSTAKERQDSRFDFGPIYSFVSYNGLEGVRFRLGGMTTANLSDRFFANGYLAFGTRDLRLKYNATAIYSLVPKEYHPYESFRHAFYLSSEYDVEVPGRKYTAFERDNIFMSIPSGTPNGMMQYVQRNKLRYEKEWPNRMSLNVWVQNEVNEAAGTLKYNRINADGSLTNVYKYNTEELGLTLRYAPGEPLFNNRMGKESLFNMAHDNPVLLLSHRVGYLNGFGVYNKTEFSMEKRFWLSSFGHIDALLSTGMVWNRAPFPLLFIPNTNQSFLLQGNAFNLMQPLEFISDSYVSLHATYYLKGWILNRIPLINKLKLREVVSFSGLYGALSVKNNPALSPEGLFQLPAGTHTLGNVPYMEMSVGLENIFRFLRVDWVHRINYLENEGAAKNGVRFSFRFAF
jgi:hypothetical protein